MSAPALEPPVGIPLLREEPLSRHTYMRVGGPAEYFATPATLDELTDLLGWAHACGLRVRPLGGGSNIVVADEGVRGLVVSLRRACGDTRFEGELVRVGAGVMLPALARAAAEHDLGGLEFAIGIPGCIGGALQSNAGIGDGRSIGQLVEAVDVLDGARRRSVPRADLTFDYRTSSLRGSGLLVLAATLRLTPRARADIEQDMQRLLGARQASQPTAEPNAGSMFRNPPGDFAGRVIEAAGCKGLAVGSARVSPLHANFIVHDGSARASDVAALMALVQERVRAQLGIELVPEVEWWGDEPAPVAFHRAKMTGP
ncbi:MAG: UDP-N-acetylmuramate dehydrogenase [Dehalococcoidia bacterium]|nr:UDP-N-acetylmuramate dehydrogenase [Dehalococcoidia bacterium]